MSPPVEKKNNQFWYNSILQHLRYAEKICYAKEIYKSLDKSLLIFIYFNKDGHGFNSTKWQFLEKLVFSSQTLQLGVPSIVELGKDSGAILLPRTLSITIDTDLHHFSL